MNINHRTHVQRWLIAAALVVGLALTAWHAPTAQAATITVTTTADENNNDGDCSLREAIIAANTDTAVDACAAGNGADDITLPAGNYTLSLAGASEDAGLTGDLDITDELTITGAGPASTTIDANGLDRVIEVHPSATTVTISGVTMTGGNSSSVGSGLRLDGSYLLLINSHVRDNTGSSGGASGIYVQGSAALLLLDSWVYNHDHKGIIISAPASVTLIRSLVSGNSSTFDGAGFTNGGTLMLVNSTVSGNSTIFNGGGIWNNGGTTALYNATVSANTADSNSSGTGDGGGLYISSGSLTMQNSIIAGNADSSTITQHPDCSGTLTSQGYNLIEHTTGCTITGDTTGNLIGVSPALRVLQDNGGSTNTHALRANSPAIDAGDPAGCADGSGTPLKTDQRGDLRPVDGGSGSARCDIGAFEYDAPTAPATTFVVERTSDAGDRNPGDGHCDISVNLGDQCGLRAAIEEVNALGADTTPYRITFNISGTGPHTIAPASKLPDLTVPVIIDGATQPGAACPTADTPANLQIVLDGSGASVDFSGLVLAAGSDGSTIRGLAIGNFPLNGIRILSSSNHVECNYVGLAADGVSVIGNGFAGIYVDQQSNTIGGQNATQRNVISGNGDVGVRIEGGASNRIVNNFVGVTADGASALGNLGGVSVLGDSTTVRDNLISGNTAWGIRVNGGDNTLIQGNLIGVARDSTTPLGNGANGIEIVGEALDAHVGGAAPGEANLIAYNGGGGVILNTTADGTPGRNRIRGNAMFDNGNLGIGLGTDGADTNDTDDGDVGENERQNYPVLVSTPGSLTISGTLDSHANAQYTIDLYRNDQCDPSGHGEGQQYVSSLIVTTDGAGDVNFVVNAAGAASGDSVTATATDADGNTSEFSACVELTQLPPDQAPEYQIALPLIVK